MAATGSPIPDPPKSPMSPSLPNTLENITAFARFEFENGKGNAGTKILMVEWQDEDKNRSPSGSWKLSWSGKTTVIPVNERTSDNTRRVYFLLPPGTMVPPHVTLLYQSKTESGTTQPQSPQRLAIYPLPAIFTPELGATAKASGKKGVLHTIWAKKRLQVLEKEIRREEEFNLEGIALEMAYAEKEWIVNNFGLVQKPSLDLSTISKFPTGPSSPSLQSPMSPGGRRLSDKLRGLSIGTSEKDLTPRINTPIRETHPLSPEGSDVAYSSFKSFHGGPLSPRPVIKKRLTSHAPPESIKAQQTMSPTASLGYVSPGVKDETTEDLFAKPLRPRSPDLPKSPFSISSAEVAPLSTIKGDD